MGTWMTFVFMVVTLTTVMAQNCLVGTHVDSGVTTIGAYEDSFPTPAQFDARCRFILGDIRVLNWWLHVPRVQFNCRVTHLFDENTCSLVLHS